MADASCAPAEIPRFLAGPSGTDASVAARLASRLACWLGTWAASVSCSACAKAATAKSPLSVLRSARAAASQLTAHLRLCVTGSAKFAAWTA